MNKAYLSNGRSFDMEGLQTVPIGYGPVNVIFGEAGGEECIIREYLRRTPKYVETQMKVE